MASTLRFPKFGRGFFEVVEKSWKQIDANIESPMENPTCLKCKECSFQKSITPCRTVPRSQKRVFRCSHAETPFTPDDAWLFRVLLVPFFFVCKERLLKDHGPIGFLVLARDL